MSDSKELWRWEAHELVHAIARREISSREAVESCLDRIEQVNPKVNAITEVLRGEALQAAEAADRQVARGEALGILHGVPVTTKVNVDQAGCATTNGVVAYRNVIANEDSPVVRNLRRAGAILVGRTNTPAFSFRWFTDNALHGNTKNPRMADLTPGGSSGGAAAAVATGMGAIAHGNDQGGSIRYPAYACGVFGLRPSFGRVPAFNPSAVSERTPFIQMSSVQGPLARSVRDIRLAYEAMSARDPRDPWWVPVPCGAESASSRAVAVCRHIDGYAVDESVQAALDVAADALKRAGYEVMEAEPPRFKQVAELWLTLSMNEVRFGMHQAVEEYGDPQIRKVIAEMLAESTQVDLQGYIRALEQRSALLRAWIDFHERYPILLMPVSWERPFGAGFDQQEGTMKRIMAAQSPLFVSAALGLPSLAVPIPRKDGLPAGVQLMGGRFSEPMLLAAAQALEGVGSSQAIDPVP